MYLCQDHFLYNSDLPPGRHLCWIMSVHQSQPAPPSYAPSQIPLILCLVLGMILDTFCMGPLLRKTTGDSYLVLTRAPHSNRGESLNSCQVMSHHIHMLQWLPMSLRVDPLPVASAQCWCLTSSLLPTFLLTLPQSTGLPCSCKMPCILLPWDLLFSLHRKPQRAT